MLSMKSFSGFLLIVILMATTAQSVAGSLLKKTFYVVKLEQTWMQAQNYCREHFTDLATITSMEEAKQTVDLFGIWIGLYRDSDTHVWQWSGGQEVDFTNWEKGYPHDSKTCVFLNENGEWRTSSCTNVDKSICYDESLILVRDNKTWTEAVEHCRALGANLNLNTNYSNWDLPSLQSKEDHLYAKKKVQEEAETDQVWTGLRFVAGFWMWVNGDQLQYDDLPVCPLTWRCGTLPKHGGQWRVKDCDEKMNFLCDKGFS